MLDPCNAITVNKPAAFLRPMALSIRGFGLKPVLATAVADGKTGTGSNGIGMAAASSWPGLAEFENYVGHGGIRCYPLESYGISGQFQFNAGLKPGSRPVIRA